MLLLTAGEFILYFGNSNFQFIQEIYSQEIDNYSNAYFGMLCSNYGTYFVILRTVVENSVLMRWFDLHPQYAYEWMSPETQKRFPPEIQAKYGISGKHDIVFKIDRITNRYFKEINKKDVGKNIWQNYRELCDYTHPNFKGWQELMGTMGKEEVLIKMPAFVSGNTFMAIKLSLFLMQMSFKTVVESFRDLLSDFFFDLEKWQDECEKLMDRYTD